MNRNLLWFSDEHLLRTDPNGLEAVLTSTKNRQFTDIAIINGNWHSDGSASLYTSWQGTNPIPADPSEILRVAHNLGLKVFCCLSSATWVPANFPAFNDPAVRDRMIETINSLVSLGYDGYIDDSELDTGGSTQYPPDYWPGFNQYLKELSASMHGQGKQAALYFILDPGTKEQILLPDSGLDFVDFAIGNDTEFGQATNINVPWLAGLFAGAIPGDIAFLDSKTYPSACQGFTVWEYYEISASDWAAWENWPLKNIGSTPTLPPTYQEWTITKTTPPPAQEWKITVQGKPDRISGWV